MADVTITRAVRDSLLTLQNTAKLVERTQGRLSSGLKVAGPVDDPVAFFQSKGLNDRASDFLEKKDNVDQGVSTLSSALDGITGIESLVRQLKGIANSMKSADSSQMADLVTQFNTLRDQLDTLATDSTYQGTNLISGLGQKLVVEFSEKTGARLQVDSVNLTKSSAGLAIYSAVSYTGNFAVTYAKNTSTIESDSKGQNKMYDSLSAGSDIALTWYGGTKTYSAGSTISFSYGTGTLSVVAASEQTLSKNEAITLRVRSAAQTSGFYVMATAVQNFAVTYGAVSSSLGTTNEFTAGETLTLTWNGPTTTISTGHGPITFSYGTNSLVLNAYTQTVLTNNAAITVKGYSSTNGAISASYSGFSLVVGSGTVLGDAGSGSNTKVYGLSYEAVTAAQANKINYVSAADTDAINAVIADLDTALTTLRTKAQTLGSNVALLSTRLDFTQNYVNTLQKGASKLTLADINNEGANLLALQTRQQLGIQALSFAGQAEQAVLGLFR